MNRFVGRASDVAEVRRALAEARLVTLTGPGGTGKTRLALRVASDVLATPDMAGRVWWADLAPLLDPEQVASAWLSAIGAVQLGDRPAVAAVADHLGAAAVLVVTDGCERLVDACAQLTAELLARCPGLTVLATSREPLGVAGEVVWPVRPLALPDRHWRPLPGVDDWPESVTLFTDRAAAVRPSFRLDDTNAATVAAICRRVDGLPLAIELAAAAVRVMRVGDIARRLETTLDLPPARGQVPDRHRTLQAAIDWSYVRLPAAEQTLFRQLSVFEGAFSLAAATAVVAGETGAHPDLLDHLAQLVDKSMITFGERQGRTEYRLLEPFRQYGRQALAMTVTGEADAMHARYTAFCRAVAEEGTTRAEVPAEAGA